MRKKMIALIVLILLLPSISAGADTIYTEGDLQYTVGQDTIVIVGYTGTAAEVTIPPIIAGNPVNTIAAGAFVGTAAKKVNLPDTIMHVEEGAFDPGIVVVFDSNFDPKPVGEDVTGEPSVSPTSPVPVLPPERPPEIGPQIENDTAAPADETIDIVTPQPVINETPDIMTQPEQKSPAGWIVAAVIAVTAVAFVLIKRKK